MDFSYIFRTSRIDYLKLQEYGFLKNDCVFSYKKEIGDGEFFGEFIISQESFLVTVYEKDTGEIYALVDVKSARGAFVNGLRNEVQEIVQDLKENCFVTEDVHERYVEYLSSHYGSEPDFPWEDSKDYAVYRLENGKWFALLMKVPFNKLGINSDEPVWIVNMKADEDKIPEMIDKRSIFPAWHMTKKHWISVLLTCATDFDRLCELTERSRELVLAKK